LTGLIWSLDIINLIAVFPILQLLLQKLQPLLVPVCFVSAWAIVLLLGWSLWSAMRDTVVQSQQLHRIPCAGCRFFTHDYHLKCTVHPSIALTKDAIDCSDYTPVTNSYY